jgi:hypothetical protein
MTKTLRFTDGAAVVHVKESDDETYCGEDAGDTLMRIEVQSIHQIGLVRGAEVCSSCRSAVENLDS